MRFFHGTTDYIEPGTILNGRGQAYEEAWKYTDFYYALEKYRPEDKIAHKDGVFMCHHPDDVDLAGGSTEYLCEMKPSGKIQRHSLNWCSEISLLMCDAPEAVEEIKRCAENYWSGKPHPDENVWEYIAEFAEVLSCEDYDEAFIDEDIPEVISDSDFSQYKKSLEQNSLISSQNNKFKLK